MIKARNIILCVKIELNHTASQIVQLMIDQYGHQLIATACSAGSSGANETVRIQIRGRVSVLRLTKVAVRVTRQLERFCARARAAGLALMRA